MTVISIALAGCSLDGTDNGPVGSAEARITQVPPMVGCISISVVGASRSVAKNFDVTSGQSAVLHMGKLPVGVDAFSASAFSVACSSIASAQPSWASTAPFYANVSQSGLTSLVLTLEPTGSASIGINFDTDGGGSCGDGGCSCGDGGCTGGDGGFNSDGGVFDLSPNFGDGGPNYDGGVFDLAYPHD